MPSFEIENSIGSLVAGVDEAGRGPWAGPVVAGAVIILDKNLDKDILSSLDDSKKISEKKREFLYNKLFAEEKKGRLYIAIGEASCREIDEMNILRATFLAMKRAVAGLKISPDYAIVDGNQKPVDFPCGVRTVVKGDSLSFSIAAASIVAKVHRDKIMKILAEKYPYYSFEKNAGYGTKLHIEGLRKYGITPEHRRSYKPIKEFL
ncbi:MAG: ribonuclease HII [Lactobacillaceae bacterium]|jgi:ribonuclease HII|nr:ribonuclease HII [Lactobacillaceae bacterium]